uniref:Histone-lysine N-methyltransferase SETMAR n=1 Tax=Heterorhabditis bacteriophora TaxID=37862 RepID=A0A1I7XC98_HETBA
MRRVAEGRGRLLAIDDSQLKAIVEEDPRKTTGEVAEELNVSQSGVRYLHRIERAIILHDNARPHVSQMTLQKVDELGYETPPYSADSPDLSPTDYHSIKHIDNFLQEKPRSIRVRGAEMIPSADIPNIPTTMSTPPHRAISPKVRHDMFRRKDSPGSGGSKWSVSKSHSIN